MIASRVNKEAPAHLFAMIADPSWYDDRGDCKRKSCGEDVLVRGSAD